MSITKWAEMEIAAACKRENPNWDGESFDYGCSCYQSALKAYKSLMEDGHSGFSFSVTKNILIKLLNEIPLSPITDEDFFTVERGTDEWPADSDEYLKEHGLKSDLQCPRRTSLFRKEDLDGNVTYRDIHRAYCINIECPSDTFNSGVTKFIDKLYPITMPYMPSDKPFKVYLRTWLTDKKHGDYDVHEIVGYEDQEGKWHDYGLFEYYGNNKCEVITDNLTQMVLRGMRIDKLENKIAAHIYNCISDEFTDKYWQTDKDKDEYNRVSKIVSDIIEPIYDKIKEYCKLFNITDEHGIHYLNTWHNHRVIASGYNENELFYKEHPKFIDFAKFIDVIKNEIKLEINNKIIK